MSVKRLISIGTSMGVFVFMLALPALAQHTPGGGGHAGGAGGIGHGAAAAGEHGNTETTGGKSSGASMKELNNVVNSNPPSKLAQKLTALLPSGMTLATASSGFKNLGQFVAALHVYKNLDIASSTACSGKTASACWDSFASVVQAKSLGGAIKQFDPTVSASAETKKANKQAKEDISENS
jgi:hypothetical protein